jgi:mRNA-degrading endonuclease YafQ of YafQ-DinJ toxin-antitoxin module
LNSLTWTDTFVRTARRFLKKHSDLRAEFERVLYHLEKDPSHPSLRLHPLKGKYQGKHAVSLAYSYRIVLILALENQEIILLDIGSHDHVYR